MIVKAKFLLLVIAVCVIFLQDAPYGFTAEALPPYPAVKPRHILKATLPDKAQKLFDYAHKENKSLVWDPCLANKAAYRARQLVEKNYFAHRDPATGKNPAWDLVASCFRCRYAGENLAIGHESPETIHLALMNSPAHRRNIVDPRFNLLGVGCYAHVCVELFAGF
jgi:uncharacterized protein YkwD